jgi:hypothetical protein
VATYRGIVLQAPGFARVCWSGEVVDDMIKLTIPTNPNTGFFTTPTFRPYTIITMRWLLYDASILPLVPSLASIVCEYVTASIEPVPTTTTATGTNTDADLLASNHHYHQLTVPFYDLGAGMMLHDDIIGIRRGRIWLRWYETWLIIGIDDHMYYMNDWSSPIDARPSKYAPSHNPVNDPTLVARYQPALPSPMMINELTHAASNDRGGIVMREYPDALVNWLAVPTSPSLASSSSSSSSSAAAASSPSSSMRVYVRIDTETITGTMHQGRVSAVLKASPWSLTIDWELPLQYLLTCCHSVFTNHHHRHPQTQLRHRHCWCQCPRGALH